MTTASCFCHLMPRLQYIESTKKHRIDQSEALDVVNFAGCGQKLFPIFVLCHQQMIYVLFAKTTRHSYLNRLISARMKNLNGYKWQKNTSSALKSTTGSKCNEAKRESKHWLIIKVNPIHWQYHLHTALIMRNKCIILVIPNNSALCFLKLLESAEYSGFVLRGVRCR